MEHREMGGAQTTLEMWIESPPLCYFILKGKVPVLLPTDAQNSLPLKLIIVLHITIASVLLMILISVSKGHNFLLFYSFKKEQGLKCWHK